MERTTAITRDIMAREIAFALTITGKEKWAVKPGKLDDDANQPTRYIHKLDNPEFELSLHFDWPNPGRLYISGNFHLAKDTNGYSQFVDVREWNYTIGGREELPSITVACSKEPAVIAMDINRRFIPAYTALFQKAIARRDEHATFRAKQLDNMRAVAMATGMHPDTFERLLKNSNRNEMDRFSFDGGAVEYASDTTVTLKLESLSLIRALEILSVFKMSKPNTEE